jgi:2'-5' RNA ligase
MVTRFPAFIAFEIPEPIRGQIKALRDSFSSPAAGLPVDLQLLGSCGAGPILPGTPDEFIEDRIESVFSRVSPWEVTFSRIEVLSDSSKAVLVPADPRPFHELHEALRSAIPHSPSLFPYTPHCTVRSGSATEEELSGVLGCSFPRIPFLIDTISVYERDSVSPEYDLILQRRLHPRRLMKPTWTTSNFNFRD